jgi:hypothetical protein
MSLLALSQVNADAFKVISDIALEIFLSMTTTGNKSDGTTRTRFELSTATECVAVIWVFAQ